MIPSPSAEPCLCVDLDGTLITGDTLRISLKLIGRRKPWLLLLIPFALLGGRPAFKRFIASHALPDPSALRWRQPVLDFLTHERSKGRRLVLATAANRRVAEAVMRHLSVFDDLVATDSGPNLKGTAKLQAIRNLLGDSSFDYVGDSLADLPVLHAARRAYLVAPSARLLQEARRVANVERIFG